MKRSAHSFNYSYVMGLTNEISEKKLSCIRSCHNRIATNTCLRNGQGWWMDLRFSACMSSEHVLRLIRQFYCSRLPRLSYSFRSPNERLNLGTFVIGYMAPSSSPKLYIQPQLRRKAPGHHPDSSSLNTTASLWELHV